MRRTISWSASRTQTLRSRVFTGVVVLTVVGLLVSAVGAKANPSLDDKRAQAQAILAEVEELDHEVGAAAERFNGANYELGTLTTRLAETRADLRRARSLQRVSQQRVASRLRALYINGPSANSIEVIIGARSLNEVLDRIDLAGRVAKQDARIAEQAVGLRVRVARQEKQLASARARQALVVEQRAAERRAIEAKLVERQRLLASVKDEVARLEEAERRHQAELRRQAQLELERQRRAAAEAAAQQAAAERARAEAARSAEQSASDPGDSAPADAASEVAPIPEPAPTYTAPPADASKGAQVVAIAMQYLGIPYRWGGASPSGGFDCSGLTMYVFAQVGVSLPHYAAAQYQLGSAVSKDQLQPGDLVFFRGLGHMGMYIGGGNMIHAPQTGDVVKISSIYDSYYVANWVGARRVL